MCRSMSHFLAAGGLSLACAGAALAQSTRPAVYIVTYPNAAPGKLSSMTIDPDGRLNLVGVYDTSDTGPQAISLAPGGRYVALSHGTANNVTEKVDIFAVNADATMTFVLTKLVPDSPLDLVWVNDHLLAVAQTNVSGSNSVGLYEFDAGAASLTEIARHDAGRFCSNLAMHPHGRFLFFNDSTNNEIYTIEIYPDDTSAVVGTAFTTYYPLGMGISHDGSLLYAGGGISGGGRLVLGYGIDALSGSLSNLPGAPYTSDGSSPKLVVTSSDDKYAFVGHGTDATLRTMRINNDGSLTSTGYQFDIGLQGTLGKVVVMGDLLFVTDNSTAIDGKSGVYSFTVQGDGSLVMNGSDLFTTGSSTPNSIAVWNPLQPMVLSVSDVVSGADAGFRVVGAAPNAVFGLVYSTRGPGHVQPNGWQVSIDLARPLQAGPTRRADGQGRAMFTLPVPNTTVPLAWFQAVRPDMKSNVVNRPVLR